MTTARKLAEAVRKMSECDGRQGVKWSLFEHCEARDKAYSLAEKILAAPVQPASETVKEMREWAQTTRSAKTSDFYRWADALEAAENEASHLRECLMKTEERLAEAGQGWERDGD